MECRTEKLKMLAGELYRASDGELTRERLDAKRLCRLFNETTEQRIEERDPILHRLLGSCGAGTFIEPPFRCDYGYNVHVGDHFYANYDLIILDCAEVRIGHHCLIGPRVSIFTATHPLDSAERASGLESARPVNIGDHVWIGGHAVINPGVTIGSHAVIGAGAVVTRDVPDHSLVVGVPAKVIRRFEEPS